MPQRGISRRVSVNFEEVGDDGKIAADAQARAETEDQTAPPTPREDTVPTPAAADPPLIQVERITETPSPLADAWETEEEHSRTGAPTEQEESH